MNVQDNIGILRRIFVLVVLLIVYGSLYPWQFAPRMQLGNPLWILLHAWSAQANLSVVRDCTINIALYIPLGMAGHLALAKRRWPLVSLYAPVLMGLALSCSMEMIQLYEPARNTSSLDVVTNLIGTVIGVALGVVFEETAWSIDARLEVFEASDRSALIMIFFWIAWLVFPFFPQTGLYVPRHKMGVFFSTAPFVLVPFISAAATWFAAGRLLDAVGIRSSGLWLGMTVFAIPAQFVIVNRQPTPSDLFGAIAGVLLFVLRAGAKRTSIVEAWIFLGVLLLRGMSPFHFAAQSTEFSWIPFGAFLGNDWLSGVLGLIEKTWYYGVAVWLLRAAGLRLVSAAAIVAATLLSIEVAQIRLPGRTPEITDPILALILAFGLGMLAGSRARAVR